MADAAQPLFDLKTRIGQASRSFLDSHPIDAVRELFGFEPPAPPPPDPNKDPYIIQQQQNALDGFRRAQESAPAMHTMKKPLGK